jgi:hypothetical protein
MFTRMVRRYSQRSLTYPGDGHDAIAAVLQALTIESTKDTLFDHPIEFVWGIPLPFFDIGLAWTTFTGQSRRDVLTSLPMPPTQNRVRFPSWCWMGWVGETSIKVGAERLETEKPVIRSYAHYTSSDGLQLRCIRDSVPNVPGFQYGLQSSTWNASKEHVVTLDLISRFYPSLTSSALATIPEYHILFFWTSVAIFRVTPVSGEKSFVPLYDSVAQMACSRCKTLEQHRSGALEPEGGTLESLPPSPPHILDASGSVVGSTCRMTSEYFRIGSYDTGMHEFIVIGRRHVEELGDEFPAQLLVMQVEMKDGIYHRVNIGEIEENAWDAAGSEWRLIALG